MSDNVVSKFFPKKIVRNQEQIDIQIAKHHVILVQANAGAAKTTTLALRIGEALANNVSPEKILALTFTDAAREVMRSRLIELGVNYKIVNEIQILTFEEFSQKVLLSIEGEEVKQIAQTRNLKLFALQALDHVAQQYGQKFDFLQIETHNIAIAQFLEAQLRLKAMMVLDPYFDLDEIENVFSLWGVTPTEYLTAIEYERIRRGKKDSPLFRAEFDATYDLAQYLLAYPGIEQHLPDYRLVICDELHDLNEAAFCILSKLIATERRCYFVGAGDEHQVIHATLGASREFLETRFKAAFPALKHLPLTITYRHDPHLAYAMREFAGKSIESFVTKRTEIQLLNYGELSESASKTLIVALKKWEKDGNSLEGCAILLRNRDQSIEIENALRIAKIDYKTPAMASYLQWEEVLFLRGIMAIVLNDLSSIKSYEVRSGVLDALATFGDLRIPASELESGKYTVAKNPELIFDFFKKFIQDANALHIKLLASIIADIKQSGPDTNAADVLNDIVIRLNLQGIARRLFIRAYDASVVEKSIAGFIDVAKQSGLNLKDFAQLLNEAETFATRKREKDFVMLDTVANVKGREFEHVIIPSMESKVFPHLLSDAKDERNLFYVAATRTKSRLSLLMPEQESLRSPFIAAMNLDSFKAEANKALARNASRETSTVAGRQYLKVPFHEKDIAKGLGARFDMARKAWYVEAGTDIKPFSAWMK
ncbi:ATP-dependent helicase [Undibacterium jejuense]|uniref:DNA 3'-5' helicase n=1 Tax=Undibacterium jejuense TaxID=1344949 RepID=A0A923KHE8_9BURK|nr:ATP-dependent helicase [Undibacterium jejuense]MBC3860772.1 ATP-dependent helicase [Undibacterium jejuense]